MGRKFTIKDIPPSFKDFPNPKNPGKTWEKLKLSDIAYRVRNCCSQWCLRTEPTVVWSIFLYFRLWSAPNECNVETRWKYCSVGHKKYRHFNSKQTRNSRGCSTITFDTHSFSQSVILFLQTFKISLHPNRKCSPPNHFSHVMCHVSRVTYQVSHVTFFFYKVVELFGGGSIINGARLGIP